MISSDLAVFGLLSYRGVKELAVSVSRLFTRRHTHSTMCNLQMTRCNSRLRELQMKASLVDAKLAKMRPVARVLCVLKAKLK